MQFAGFIWHAPRINAGINVESVLCADYLIKRVVFNWARFWSNKDAYFRKSLVCRVQLLKECLKHVCMTFYHASEPIECAYRSPVEICDWQAELFSFTITRLVSSEGLTCVCRLGFSRNLNNCQLLWRLPLLNPHVKWRRLKVRVLNWSYWETRNWS